MNFKFHDSTEILDNLVKSERPPSIKYGLGFHEIIKGESSSQEYYGVNKENSENTSKELRIE